MGQASQFSNLDVGEQSWSHMCVRFIESSSHFYFLKGAPNYLNKGHVLDSND